jgi:hypothetical protein
VSPQTHRLPPAAHAGGTSGAAPWRYTALLVPKKDGKDRMVVDFRALNSITKKDSYPLPRIDDIFDGLGRATVYSCLDAMGGYNQVELDEGSREKTAFATPHGLFHYNVLPQGCCNSPSTFQRLMNHVLRDYLAWALLLLLP